ncbi:MAG: glycosyltransferase family 4 protein [Hydrogenophaga sp.]|uniref:glycosyltransferase family 4 protein n=1 Tax=Hydrogenophaga sp. TaxID=1904254 RepID=UPI0025C573C8|nr:glycosyltransferase family 4 protein [Hydrogenophaga sp.]MBU7573899.1 glycosyltransferase family 4 protein [Hydrogenophaga sp.]
MKIVHVEDFIHPDAGYQVNMLGRLQVQQGHQVEIVTGEMEKIPDFLTAFFGRERIQERDERYRREAGARIHRVPLHGFYSGRAIFHTFKLFRKVRELKPDVVFVHGEDTLTGILFIWLARWLPYPLVLDCHMLEMASKNRFREYFRSFYRRFVTPVILKRNIPLIRVVDSDFVEKCLGIPLSRTHYLSLGTDTDFFQPDVPNKAHLRAELGLDPNAFVVLYAGKLDEHKGGIFFSETLKGKLEAADNRPIEFLIIGNTVGEYGKKVEENLTISENRIVRRPTQRYLDLAKFYQAADLAVFPKQCSMSFFEAQACGLPVLFEENEINNMRAVGDNAFTFQPGSIESFREKLIWLASQPPATFQGYSTQAREYVLRHFDFVPIAQQYSAVLLEAAEKWNNQGVGSTHGPRTS